MVFTVAIIKNGKIEVKQNFTERKNAEYYKAGIVMGLLLNSDESRSIEIYETED